MKSKIDLSGYLIWFAVGVLIGCLYFNCLWRFGSFLNLSERMVAMDRLVDGSEYGDFWELGIGILGGLIYIFTLCSGFTYLGPILSNGFCLIMGIWWGSFFTECMISKGLSFILIICKRIFPECVLFVAAFVSCLIWVNNMSTSYSGYRRRSGKNAVKYWKILVLSILFFIFWCISSFYVNFWRPIWRNLWKNINKIYMK